MGTEEQKAVVLIADRPRPIEAAAGYGDWVPVIEMRRVFQDGKTVRMQLAIRGQEGKPMIELGNGRSIVLELPASDYDIRPVIRQV